MGQSGTDGEWHRRRYEIVWSRAVKEQPLAMYESRPVGHVESLFVTRLSWGLLRVFSHNAVARRYGYATTVLRGPI